MCKLIWKYVLNNYPEFKTCPGGVGQVHHNYIGGLLEHTCSMITLLRGRTDIDLSIALTGALLHDIGKIQAYQWDTVIEMSDSGRLLGHLNLGYEMLCEIVKSRSISRKHFNHVVLLKLKHIILSHHGINEIKPMFPEAVAVSAADGFDSGVNHSVNWIANPGSWGGMQKGNWTSFCNLTERFYYSPNEPVIPIAKENTFQPKKDDNSMF